MKKILPVELSLLSVVLIWGVNFAVVKGALDQFHPDVFNALRFLVASIVLPLIAARRLPSLQLSWRDGAALFAIGLIFTAFYQILFIAGIARTTSSNAAVELAATPTAVAALSYFLGREKPGRKTWGGILLAFFGLYLVIAYGANALTLDSSSLTGDLLVTAAMLLWAVYTTLAKPFIQRFANLKLTTWSIVFGTAALLLWATPEMIAQDWRGVTLAGWIGVLFSGIFAIAISYFIWNGAIVRVGATKTAIFSNLIPIVAVVTGAVFLGEFMTAPQIGGVAAVIAGVVLAKFE